MTTTATTSLAAFLSAQLDADEAAARAIGLTDVPTLRGGCRGIGCARRASAPHALGCPVRVLAQVAAMRRIVELHEGEHDCAEEFGPLVLDAEPEVWTGVDSWGQPFVRQSIGTTAILPCPTLRALASIYAGADGWREEWGL